MSVSCSALLGSQGTNTSAFKPITVHEAPFSPLLRTVLFESNQVENGASGCPRAKDGTDAPLSSYVAASGLGRTFGNRVERLNASCLGCRGFGQRFPGEILLEQRIRIVAKTVPIFNEPIPEFTNGLGIRSDVRAVSFGNPNH